MTLESNFSARVSAKTAIALTNPDLASATSTDTARLTEAANDVKGDFRVYANVVYDDTDNRHVSVAVQGVIIHLLMAQGNVNAFDQFQSWIERVRALGQVTGRDRIVPSSTSVLEPTADGGDPPRDWADKRTFPEFNPNHPSGFDGIDENS